MNHHYSLINRSMKNEHAQSLAKIRWAKTTGKKREDHIKKMNKARLKKMKQKKLLTHGNKKVVA